MVKPMDCIDLKRKKMGEGKVKRNNSTNNSIINLANRCLEQYFEEKGYYLPEDKIINIDEIYESVIYPEYEIILSTNYDLGFIEDTEDKILGKTIPKERVILIDKSLAPESGDPRYTFTLGHEIGHGLLHADKKQLFRCSSKSIFKGTNLYEKEANCFSENLLMPRRLVFYRFVQYYKPSKPIIYRGEGEYWLGYSGKTKKQNVYSFQDYCGKLARPLTRYFSNISKESLGYRLCNLGLVQSMTKETLALAA